MQGKGEGGSLQGEKEGGRGLQGEGKGMGADCTSFIAVNNRYFN